MAARIYTPFQSTFAKQSVEIIGYLKEEVKNSLTSTRIFTTVNVMDLLFIALRSIVVYVFIIIAIRIFGKREISQLSIIDLVFVLLISNSVQNAMVGPDTSLLGGLIAACALFIVNAVLGKLLFRSKKISHLLQGEDVLLIYHGKKQLKHMQKAEISNDELQEAIREHGVADEKEVDMAVLETDGTISILSHNFTHKTTKKRRVHKSLLDQNS